MSGNRKSRLPRKTTLKSIENAALSYLQRYATSAENLRAVLTRKIYRAAHAHDEDPAEGIVLVDALIDRYLQAGLLNDAIYAEGRVAALHRRGVSRRGIQSRLSAKGVAVDVIEKALDLLSADIGNSEFVAACNYARRRRLGPWRIKDRPERRDRDLAALARQGYGYELAHRVIDAENVAALEEE